jgi:hypothetical protein
VVSPVWLAELPSILAGCYFSMRVRTGVSAHEQRGSGQHLRGADVPKDRRKTISRRPARSQPRPGPGGFRGKDRRGFPDEFSGARSQSSADLRHPARRRAPRVLLASSRSTLCEWKGGMHYRNVRGGTIPRDLKPATSVTAASGSMAAGSPVTCAAYSKAGAASRGDG